MHGNYLPPDNFITISWENHEILKIILPFLSYLALVTISHPKSLNELFISPYLYFNSIIALAFGLDPTAPFKVIQ